MSLVQPQALSRAAAFRSLAGRVVALTLGLATITIAGADEPVPFRHFLIDTSGPPDMHAKAVGDFDGDGYVDLLAAGTEGVIYWYEYPDWDRHTMTTGGGGWGTEAEAGDVDGDGDPDLVVSDYYQNDRMVWFENPGPSGDPRTGPWTMHVIGPPKAHDIELADLDGDGDLDIVTRQQYGAGNELVLWQQNAPLSWSKRTLGTLVGEGLHVGDIDQDGDPDLLIGGRWYENTGDILNGAWQERVFASNWAHQDTLPWLGDINGDGRPDVVLTPSESAGGAYRTSWYEAPLDPTEGDWVEHVIDQPIETVTHSLGVGDMNNDGTLDVVTAEMHQGADPDEVRVYLNDDGDGLSWTKQVVDTKGSHSIRVIDVGNDGDLDIFGANWSGTGDVDLWENQTDPDRLSLDDWTFVQVDDSRALSPTGGGFFGLDMADVDNDGDGDIVSGEYFYRNPGGDMTGNWDRVAFPIVVDGMLIVDVDGDLFADAIAEALPEVYWLEATDAAGNGWTSRSIATLPSTSHGSGQGYVVAQIVAGGRSEILLSTGNGIHYLEIPGSPETGAWPTTRINSPGTEEGVGIGDIDGDGDIDVTAGVEDGTGRVAWWENPGNGASDWPTHEIGSLPGPYADRFGVADLDGDGNLDIVVSAANGSNNGVYWFRQPADPQNPAWPRQLVFSLDSANSMDVADMDGDGDPDVITGEHQGALRVFVLENIDHAGSWAAHQVDTGRESHLGTRVADLDGDGDLEIVSIAWNDYQDLYLWRNDAQSSGTSKVARPVIQPSGEPFVDSVLVSVVTATPGASSYYTVNGEDPTQNSSLYTDPILLTYDATVRARSFKSGMDASDVSTEAFTRVTPITTPQTSLTMARSDGRDVLNIGVNESMVAHEQGPVASFTANPPTGFSPLVVSFDASASTSPEGDGLVCSWRFGDGGTATGVVVEHTYLAAGSYTATLTVYDGRTSDTAQTLVTVSTVPPAGLLAHWTLDESAGNVAVDSVGGFDGTLVSAPAWLPGQGRIGGALEFDGADDYVDLGTFEVGGNALTIAGWMLADSFGVSDARFLSKATGTNEDEHYFMLSTVEASGPRLRFRLKTSVGGTSTLIGSVGTLQTGAWIHFAAVYDGEEMRLYQDGALVGSLVKTGALVTDAAVPTWLGRNPGGYGPFDGLMDDLRIYDRALSVTEIEGLADPTIVNEPPVASFTANPATGTEPLIVSFDASASTDPEGGTLTYSWQFGDGSTATGVVVGHTYVAAGSYTATLTVDDGQASDAAQTLITVSIAPPEGMLAHWTLDESAGNVATDSVAGFDGTLVNAPVWRPGQGRIGGALDFDGAFDYVDLGAFEVGGNALTIAGWIRADTFGVADARILSKATGTNEEEHYLMLSTVESNGPKLRFRLKTSGGGTSTLIGSAGALQTGVWTHFAAVYDGEAMRLYQDGAPVGSLDKTGTLATDAAAPTWLGRNPGGYGPFDGQLDDLRFYDRALSVTEIEELANPGVPQGGLLALWALDESEGTVATDGVGGFDGTLVNAPEWRPGQGRIGGALEFDGVDDHVDLGTFEVSGSALTIAGWMLADSLDSSEARILSKATGTNEDDHYLMLSTIDANGPKLRFRLKTSVGGTSTLIESSGTLQAGMWIHVAAVYDGNEMRLFQDGVPIGTLEKTGTLVTDATVPTWLGCNPGGHGPFDGLLDDIRVYDRALSATEIEGLAAPR